MTLNSIIVMRQETFESIKKPLDRRTIIVVTNTEVASDNVMIFDNFNEAIEFAKKLNKDIFVIK